jgi:hypothetical protein
VQSATRAKDLKSVEENFRVRNGSFLLSWAAVCCLVFAGCGNPAGHYPVNGQVLYKGEPAPGAVVYFHQEGPSATATDTLPVGIADEGGNFRLSRDGIGDGCLPGKYAVLVEWKGKADSQGGAQADPHEAKGEGNNSGVHDQQAVGAARR